MKLHKLLPLIAGFIALLALTALPQMATVAVSAPNGGTGAPPPAKAEICPDNGHEPHYYFGDQPKEGEYSFGPAASGSTAKELIDEPIVRLCGNHEHAGDPALFAAIQAAAQPSLDPNRQLTLTEWRAQLSKFVANIDIPASAVTTQVDGDTTMMMRWGSNDVLHIVTVPHAKEGTFLVLALQDGTRLTLRTQCGFQPIW